MHFDESSSPDYIEPRFMSIKRRADLRAGEASPMKDPPPVHPPTPPDEGTILEELGDKSAPNTERFQYEHSVGEDTPMLEGDAFATPQITPAPTANKPMAALQIEDPVVFQVEKKQGVGMGAVVAQALATAIAIAALVYLLVFRISLQSRYRSSFLCIEIVFAYLVKICASRLTWWSGFHVAVTNIVFLLDFICNAIVFNLLNVKNGETGDLMAWNLTAFIFSLTLWASWPLGLQYCCCKKKRKEGEGHFTGAAPSERSCVCTFFIVCVVVVLVIVAEVLLILFLFTAYGSVSRVVAFTQRYPGDRTVVAVAGEDISLQSTCFCHGTMQPFADCYTKQLQVFVLEPAIGLPVEIYYRFLQELTLNIPNAVACLVSRPGNDWSDALTLESLNTQSLPSDNVHYLQAWMVQNKLSTPVFLIGHQYGGYHIAQFLMQYPQLVRALVFLDSYPFSADAPVPETIPALKQVVQLYGLEGLFIFWCDIGQLAKLFERYNITFFDTQLQYSMASKFAHTQMLETAIRDQFVNLAPAVQQAKKLCGQNPQAKRVPALWLTASSPSGGEKGGGEKGGEENYACLANLASPILTYFNLTTGLFHDRTKLLEHIMAFLH